MTARRRSNPRRVRTIVFDSEAVDALRDPHHGKHRVVLAHLEAAVARRDRGWTVTKVVPTSVRVEASWDRTADEAAAINRFRVRDQVLDGTAADAAARLRSQHGVSVADAHLGVAVLARVPTDDVVVLTSDPTDVKRIVDPARVTIVSI